MVDYLEAEALGDLLRGALENAVSVAGVLLLAEATVTDLPEPKRGNSALGDFPEA